LCYEVDLSWVEHLVQPNPTYYIFFAEYVFIRNLYQSFIALKLYATPFNTNLIMIATDAIAVRARHLAENPCN